MRQRHTSLLAMILFLAPMTAWSQAQNITTPSPSPAATVTQGIGMSEVTIVYHRPGVKERQIWDGLVPYNEGKPSPWRAGANENTTIEFTSDVLVNGRQLSAGTYGLHMIPAAGNWTVIFSRNHSSWGSFFYKPEEDALRVEATPVAVPHEEWLLYGFEDLHPLGATAYLRWEKLKVPFRIELAGGHASIIQSIRDQLRGLPGFFSQGFVAAAQYCANNDIELEQGLQWADQGIANGGGFNARAVKAQLLEKTGKGTEAAEMLDQAIALANENELNNYGYQLMNQGKVAEAIVIFKENVKRYPDSWNVYDSLAEGLDTSGDTKSAIDYYKQALEQNPPEAQVERINGVLRILGKKL